MPGRDNGFIARHYVPLADLDPRLADAMLDVLRAEGIAAYVVPSTGRLGGYLEVHLPERPRDRLWVDRAQHDRASALLDAHSDRPDLLAASSPDDAADGTRTFGAPGPAARESAATDSAGNDAPLDTTASGIAPFDATYGASGPGSSTDEEWARIVASFDLPSTSELAPWPPAEDLRSDPIAPNQGMSPGGGSTTDPREATPVPRRIVRPVDRVADSAPADPFASAGTEYDPLSALDEHFVPEPPPPLPRLRRGTRWALAVILGGVALLIGQSFTTAIPDAVALGVLAIVGGFVALVAMMREDRPSDSDPDDGAVV